MNIQPLKTAPANTGSWLQTVGALALLAVGIHVGADQIGLSLIDVFSRFGVWLDTVFSSQALTQRLIGLVDLDRATGCAHGVSLIMELAADLWFGVPFLLRATETGHSANPLRPQAAMVLRLVQAACLGVFLLAGWYAQNRQTEATLLEALLNASTTPSSAALASRTLAAFASALILWLVVPKALWRAVTSSPWIESEDLALRLGAVIPYLAAVTLAVGCLSQASRWGALWR